MASRRNMYPSEGSSSLRQSLGMPLRGSTASGKPAEGQEWAVPTGRPPSRTKSQGGPRRQTYVASSGTKASLGPAYSRTSSQHRQAVGTGASRPSTGRSSVYGGTSGVKKDPRPLSDKGHQIETIKRLIRFLGDNNYPKNVLSVKSLQTPTCKEFLHIFNFLLELIDESLVINGLNIVEEVPSVLKILGYPFTVSKNHLLNVGSPHSWPILLGAISWLMDCCSFPDNTSQVMFHSGSGFGDDEDADEEEFEYQIEEMMYSAYMVHGEDSEEYQAMVESRRESVRSVCAHLQADTERLMQENSQMSETVNELSKSSLSALQGQVQQNQNDYEELSHHLNNEVQQAIKDMEDAKAESYSRTSEVEMQLEASREKIQELEEQIRHQPMSVVDARDLHQGIKNTEDMLEMVRAQDEESAGRISELQMQHNRNVMLINNQCQQINRKLLRVAALLPDLASLPPLNYETSKRADPEVLQSLIKHAKFLRDEIQKLYRGVANSIHECESKLLSAESTQSTLRTELVKKDLEVANLQHTFDVAKEDLDNRRKLNEEAMKSELVEKLALEDNLRHLQQRLKLEPLAEKNYAAFKTQYESEMAAMEKDLEGDDDQLKELVAVLLKFIETLHDHQGGVGNQVAELLKQFKELKIPTVHHDYLTPFDPKSS